VLAACAAKSGGIVTQTVGKPVYMNEKINGISVIVCYRDPVRCEKLKNSIADTIGVEYEIIAFDNSIEKWGLCRVYNHCAKKAGCRYLCFIHEDVVIVTKDWGAALIKFAESTPDCGVIGIAGGTVAHKNFILWNDGWPDNNIRYRFWDPAEGKYGADGTPIIKSYNPDNAAFAKVVTLDGCFLFASWDLCAQKPFDEGTFTGFHLYDADFTLKIAQTKQNYVCCKIDIYHYSGGTHNDDFCRGVRKFQIKWRSVLPFSVGSEKISGWRELNLATEYIGKCLRSKAYGWGGSISHSVRLNGYVFTAATPFCFCVRKILKLLTKLKILKKRET